MPPFLTLCQPMPRGLTEQSSSQTPMGTVATAAFFFRTSSSVGRTSSVACIVDENVWKSLMAFVRSCTFEESCNVSDWKHRTSIPTLDLLIRRPRKLGYRIFKCQESNMDNLKVMAAVIIMQLYIEHNVVNLLIAEIVLIIMKQLSLCIRVCAVIAVLKCSKVRWGSKSCEFFCLAHNIRRVIFAHCTAGLKFSDVDITPHLVIVYLPTLC